MTISIRSATFLLTLIALASCSSPSAGAGGAGGTADAKSDVELGFKDADAAETADVLVGDGTATDADSPGDLTESSDAASGSDADDSDMSGFFDDTADAVAVVCGDTGTVKGTACAPKAGISVAFASVALDVNTPCTPGSSTFHADATADAKGMYSFSKVPPGNGTVTVVKGSFKTTIPVTVTGGSTVDLTLPTSDRCFKSNGLKIAVITGDADQIESLLDDLGFTHDNFATGASGTIAKSAAASFLTDSAKMDKYDVIFVDCGSSLDSLMTAKPAIVTNVQKWVAAGHSFYASDWGWQIVEAAFPSAIDFYGADASLSKSTTGPSTTAGPRQGPGPTLAQKKAGTPAFTMTGTIVDSGLSAVLGKTSSTIYEDLGTWVVMQSAGTGTVVEIEADVSDAKGASWGTVPLVVRFPSGKGHVVYTSFHNIAVKDAGGPVDDIKAILTYLVFTL